MSRRGGKRPGAGAKPLYGEPLKQVSISLTPGQQSTFERVGGAKWLRDSLDRISRAFGSGVQSPQSEPMEIDK